MSDGEFAAFLGLCALSAVIILVVIGSMAPKADALVLSEFDVLHHDYTGVWQNEWIVEFVNHSLFDSSVWMVHGEGLTAYNVSLEGYGYDSGASIKTFSDTITFSGGHSYPMPEIGNGTYAQSCVAIDGDLVLYTCEIWLGITDINLAPLEGWGAALFDLDNPGTGAIQFYVYYSDATPEPNGNPYQALVESQWRAWPTGHWTVSGAYNESPPPARGEPICNVESSDFSVPVYTGVKIYDDSINADFSLVNITRGNDLNDVFDYFSGTNPAKVVGFNEPGLFTLRVDCYSNDYGWGQSAVKWDWVYVYNTTVIPNVTPTVTPYPIIPTIPENFPAVVNRSSYREVLDGGLVGNLTAPYLNFIESLFDSIGVWLTALINLSCSWYTAFAGALDSVLVLYVQVTAPFVNSAAVFMQLSKVIFDAVPMKVVLLGAYAITLDICRAVLET